MSGNQAWIEVLLARWGRWAIRCESGALGFASSSILACGGDGDGFDSSIPLGVMSDDLEAVDGAVRKLPKVLRLTIIEVYQFGQGKSKSKLALSLGLSRQAFTDYLYRAHQKIVLDLNSMGSNNPHHSANHRSCADRKQPVTATA